MADFQQGLVELQEAQRLEKPLSPISMCTRLWVLSTRAIMRRRHGSCSMRSEFEPAFWPAHYSWEQSMRSRLTIAVDSGDGGGSELNYPDDIH